VRHPLPLALLLALLFGCARSEVYVIAGQSNAVGWSSQPRYMPKRVGRAFRKDHRWVPTDGKSCLQAFLGRCHGRSGPWERFVELHLASGRARSVALIEAALAGTTLVYPALYSAKLYWRPDDLEGGLTTELLKEVADSGLHPTAVLWLQGESDWVAAYFAKDSPQTLEEKYTRAFDRFAERITHQLHVPIIAIPPPLSIFPEIPREMKQAIQRAQERVARSRQEVCIGAHVDDLGFQPDPENNHHIYDVHSLAERWNQAVERCL